MRSAARGSPNAELTCARNWTGTGIWSESRPAGRAKALRGRSNTAGRLASTFTRRLPPPGPEPHAGTGGPPGPTTVQNLDLNVDYNNSTLGVDPAEQRRQDGIRQDRGIAKAAPINLGG